MWSALGPEKALRLLSCAVVAALLVATLSSLLGIFVFGPLRHRAGRLHAATQFQLSDFFWLVAQLQFALVYSVRNVGVEQLSYFLLVFGFLLLATLGLWAGAMSFMSRAGVRQPLRRAVFILLLLPATLALMIGTSFLVVIIPASLYVDHLLGYGTLSVYVGAPRLMDWGHTSLVLLGTGLVAAAWTLRRIAYWIQREATPADSGAGNSTVAPLSGA